jgi:hypothetical protein
MNNQFEAIKQLEYMIAFQNNCLRDGNWEDFDKAEGEVKKLEEKIIGSVMESSQRVVN